MPFNLSDVYIYLQDYHWWWRSFLTGGCTAVYFFLYSIHFFVTKLTIAGTASTFLYFGYTLIMVLIFFLFTGKISCINFVFLCEDCSFYISFERHCDLMIRVLASGSSGLGSNPGHGLCVYSHVAWVLANLVLGVNLR